MNSAIVLEDVTKRYNGVTAVKRASFEVPKGEVFGILVRVVLVRALS